MDPRRLKSVPLFAGLSKKELELLGRWTDEVDVEKGKFLAEQGRFAYEFFVIEDGSAEVVKNDKTIARLGPGDFFGEIALLESDQRTASVKATSPMTLIVMSGREFRSMENALPQVASEIRSKVQERLTRDEGP